VKIFVAGATGTMGRPLVRRLISAGHQVVGLTRSRDRARQLQSIGVRAVVGDALDREQIRSLVADARPDQVVHLLTAIPPGGVLRARQLRATNELRTAGTANLISAAVAAGARRLVAESFVGVYGNEVFSAPVTEDEPLRPVQPGALKNAVVAMRSLEDQLRAARAARQIDTVSLRFGLLYGPDVPSTDAMIEQARAGRLFAPGKMTGVGAFVHIRDATSALVAAIERPAPWFRYNIVDDEPVAFDEFLVQLTASIGVRPPRRIPLWLLKLAAPVIAEMASARLVLSNAKAKADLGWSLEHPSVRSGLADLRRILLEAA
jgi:2-alkyl-3-oxoalkanoate reductase